MLQHTALMALSGATHNSPTATYATTSSLDKLVDDIVIQILQTLSVHAVLSLRKVSPVFVRDEDGHAKDARRLDGTTSSVNFAASGTLGFALKSWHATCLHPVRHGPSLCSPQGSSNNAL